MKELKHRPPELDGGFLKIRMDHIVAELQEWDGFKMYRNMDNLWTALLMV